MEILKSFGLVRPRTLVLLALLVLPVLVYAIVGTIAVWQMGWMIWLWWLVPVFWLMTWVVAKFWPASNAKETESLGSPHWTPRDAEAAEIVRGFQTEVENLTPEQLTDVHLYLNQAQALAEKLARHYHPGNSDPISSLTAAEILAAIRLVADDLETVVLKSVPGSRMLTVGQWKKLGNAPKWIRGATQAFWAASILVNPANLARYGASRITNDQVTGGIQNELLLTVYLKFIRQVGFYLIEMNSGRLRGGADVYRANFQAVKTQPSSRPNSSSSATFDKTENATNQHINANDSANDVIADSLRIVLVGQTSAGKSSLIQQLTGSAIEPVSATASVKVYELNLPDRQRLSLVDTPGYGDSGASPQQLKSIQTSMVNCHGVLLVLDSHSPARAADVKTLKKLNEHFKKNPRLKPPPVIAVLTHIDLLPPSLEWSPPYNLFEGGPKKSTAAHATNLAETPHALKATQIRDSIAYNREVLGDSIVDATAVCLSEDPDRQWGVVENLLPMLLQHLAHSEAVSQVAAFEKALNRNRYTTIFNQATTSGKNLLRTWWEERNRDR